MPLNQTSVLSASICAYISSLLVWLISFLCSFLQYHCISQMIIVENAECFAPVKRVVGKIMFKNDL